jgi:3'(2'), 5'-bisphosphate nucleotidase
LSPEYAAKRLKVGDFSAQAVINTILSRAFPQDPIVGEEDAADLRAESGVALRNRIVELANKTITAPLQPGEKENWGLGPTCAQTAEQIMDIIDRGNYGGGRTGRQ